MFAPPTNMVYPTAIGIEVSSKEFCGVLIPGLDSALSRPLFPVYRLCCPAAQYLPAWVLGFMSPSSRVGQ